MNEATKWNAIVENNSDYDSRFYYAVKSTGIFCRPSCKSRIPRQDNVEYFRTAQDAMDAGYRPCKRCRPDLIDYQPVRQMAEQVKVAIDAYYNDKNLLSDELNKIGVSKHRVTEIFREQFDITPIEYADKLKIEVAKDRLANSREDIIDIAMFLEFDSVSAFYNFFNKYTKIAPGEYRRLYAIHRPSIFQPYYIYETSLGKMIIVSDGHAISAVQFESTAIWNGKKSASRLTDLAARQLEEYFEGKRKQFDLPILPDGTVFQQLVWKELLSIPYGETRSYKQVAQSIGNPGACRAIGMANNKTPF